MKNLLISLLVLIVGLEFIRKDDSQQSTNKSTFIISAKTLSLGQQQTNIINPTLYSEAMKQLKKEEYQINWQGKAVTYQLQNRANDLRFKYRNKGFLLKIRTTKIQKS